MSVDHTPLELARMRTNSRLMVFTLDNHQVRGALIPNFYLAEVARHRHALEEFPALILTQALCAAALLSLSLKNQEKIKLILQTSGPGQGWAVEANAAGEVRGYLFQKSFDKMPLGQLYGEGDLTVTRFLEGEKFSPMTSTISGNMGDLAEDLEHFMELSEQISSALVFSKEWCLLLQTLPGCPQEIWNKREAELRTSKLEFPAPTKDNDANTLLSEIFTGVATVLDHRRTEFFCACNRERFASYIKALPADERKELSETGPFPVEIVCQYCNSQYLYQREEIHEIC